SSHLDLVGISTHIGSQITQLGPFQEAALRMVARARELQQKGFALEFINLGGGLAIQYLDEVPPDVGDYAKTLLDVVAPTGLKLLLEPGRSIVGPCGALVTKVVYVKRTPKKKFVVVDAAMNDLIR